MENKTLVVNGSHEGLHDKGSYYAYDGDIVFDGSIIINVNLFVSGKIEADGWIRAGEGIEMYGIQTRSLLIINGTYTYTIWVMETHIKIGCHIKTKEEWLEIDTEEKAEELGDDGSMWANRELIKALCVKQQASNAKETS